MCIHFVLPSKYDFMHVCKNLTSFLIGIFYWKEDGETLQFIILSPSNSLISPLRLHRTIYKRPEILIYHNQIGNIKVYYYRTFKSNVLHYEMQEEKFLCHTAM